MKLIWKILKFNISPWQLVGFSFANLLGITILLITFQFRHDVAPKLTGNDSLVGNDYLVISKKANTLASMQKGRGRDIIEFSEQEIDELRKNKKITAVGKFTPSNFGVKASLTIANGETVRSTVFCESVPDRFVDTEDFRWSPEGKDTIIPIMIPQDYLDLYNFGISVSQELPQLTESFIKSLTIDITVKGDGKEQVFKGKFKGFSKYLNTILVPEQFVEWANGKFSSGEGKGTSRLILDVKNPADKELIDSLEAKGYVIAQNKENYSKLTFFLNLTTVIIFIIGFVISLLSLFILTLSIYLLIEKNHTKIHGLMLLGHNYSKVAIPYSILITVLNVVTFAIATVSVLGIRSIYTDKLASIMRIGGDLGFTLLMSLLMFAIVTLLHYFVLSKTIRKVYSRKQTL